MFQLFILSIWNPLVRSCPNKNVTWLPVWTKVIASFIPLRPSRMFLYLIDSAFFRFSRLSGFFEFPEFFVDFFVKRLSMSSLLFELMRCSFGFLLSNNFLFSSPLYLLDDLFLRFNEFLLSRFRLSLILLRSFIFLIVLSI